MLRDWIIFDKLPAAQLIKVKQIHVFEGGRSALYITSGDIVYGVGANGNYNLLGLSGRERNFSMVLDPVSVERLSLKAIKTIAVGEYFGVANNSNGELYHWGRRMDKRRGILLPHQVKCSYFVVDLACGGEFFVILTKEQRVFIRGAFQQHDIPVVEFREISIGFTVSWVSCGKYHVSLLSTEGYVYNCGYDHQSSYKSWRPEEGNIPKRLDVKEKCIQVVCGRRSTVCLLASGSVWAFGENENLGVESECSVMRQAVKVKISEPIRELAATWYSNCYAASTCNGRIYSWGHKTRWPTVIADGTTLIDAFRNKETPSTLGIIPIAPQLSPASSFNTKVTYNVAMSCPKTNIHELERSLSVDDLCRPPQPKIDAQPKPQDRNNNDKNNRQVEINNVKSSSSSKINKNAPPGFGLLVSAGRFLASRPGDRQTNAIPSRRRAISPEPHPSKMTKPRLTIANGTSSDQTDLTRSASVENLDSPPPPPSNKKPRALSAIFGRSNLFDNTKKSPLTSPDKETAPNLNILTTAELDKPPVGNITNSNPFYDSHISLYPSVHIPEDNETNSSSKPSELPTNPAINSPPTTNPFLYDPINCIQFKFYEGSNEKPTESDQVLSTNGQESGRPPYNPGTKAILKYYSALADIKSEFLELQGIMNELANVFSNL